jgi:uncharacterized protein DUF5666
MNKRIALAAALFALTLAPAVAQTPPAGTPARIRGTVDKLDGQSLSVKSRDGQTQVVAVPPEATIQTLVKKSVADLKAGDVIASAGVKDPAGKLRATEIRIMPRPWADGGRQLPWDFGPDSVMTNATIGTVNQASDGALLHVTFKDGEADFSIGPEVPVLAPAAGDAALLKPGAAIMIFGVKQPDGGLTARAVYVEKDGVKPPM